MPTRYLLSLLILGGTSIDCAGQAQWPQEPDGFKGVKFGATEKEARTVLHFMSCYGKKQLRNCTLRISGGDFGMLATFIFQADHLVGVNGFFMPENYSIVGEMFISLYGAPHARWPEAKQNRWGATFYSEILQWKGKLSVVQVERYGRSIEEGLFVVRLIDFPDPARDAREAAREKALQ